MVSMDKGRDLKDSSARGPDLKLFVRDVRDRQGRKRPITVRSWSTIKDVKQTIQQAIHVPPSAQCLYYGPLLTSGGELPNHRTLHDAGIYRSGETLLLDIKSGLSSVMSSSMYSLHSDAGNDVTISSSVIDSTPRLLTQIVQKSRRGLALGLKPEFVLDGSGGTYFLHDARKVKISVFKPADEEPYAENNPRGYLKQPGQLASLREGVVPGEACIREVAAFALDHGGFSGVPMTTLVEARHPSFNTNGARLKVAEGGASIGAHSITHSHSAPIQDKKVGSFQEFVRAECTIDDLSPTLISVDEIHKIAILDIRIMNADRNSANLLCRRRRDNSIELVPIDHGFSLRSVADVSWMDWCWLDWPQLKQPLSEKSKQYVMNLNIEKDASLLEERFNICQDALDYFRASSSILKAGVKAGLTLYDIACMCCRNDNQGEIPSKLEVLFSMASELAHNAVENGRWHHAAASRALAEQLSPKGGSLLVTNNKSGISKSVSMVHFSQYNAEGVPELTPPARENALPGMIQSSASDSSSDSLEENEDDCCEEWAANLIADVSLDKSLAMLQTTTKGRSLSIESDSSDEFEVSSSPQGFWHVRPGSFSVEGSDSSDDEEGSTTWSPGNSPSEFLDLSVSSFGGRRGSYNPSAPGRRASLISPVLPPTMYKSSSKVTFAETIEPPPLFYMRASIADVEHVDCKRSISCDAVESPSLFPPKPESNGIKRSLSYSALSERMHEEEKEASIQKPLTFHENEKYRDYFLKFVDLVIVRETTAAARPTEATA